MTLLHPGRGLIGLMRLSWLSLLVLAVPAMAGQLCRDPQQQDQPMRLPNADASLSLYVRFVALDAQRVLDRQTGLEWQRCSQGLSGPGCQQGKPARLSIAEASNLIAQIRREGWAGHTDWRLPSEQELRSLLKPDCINPALDSTAFPNTPALLFWSASREQSAYRYVDFKDGHVDMDDMNLANPIRLVRGSPIKPAS